MKKHYQLSLKSANTKSLNKLLLSKKHILRQLKFIIKEIKKYIKETQPKFFEDLFSLIRIPSVSSHSHRKDDLIKCAEQWKNLLFEAGVDTAEILPTNGNPVVFATKIIDPKLPTVMVYGHYDVMPAEPLDL